MTLNNHYVIIYHKAGINIMYVYTLSNCNWRNSCDASTCSVTIANLHAPCIVASYIVITNLFTSGSICFNETFFNNLRITTTIHQI